MSAPEKYDAFISYSTRADGRLAPALQRALERFAKPWYRVRQSRVFHDDSGLSVTEALWPRLHQVICDSRHFLLLASPEAARSEWVTREVAARIEQNRPILIALTDGQIVWDATAGDFDWEHTDALPRQLSGCYEHEPLYVDFRWVETPNDLSLRHPSFHDAVASLAATIQGIDKDELSSLAVTQHRRTLRLAWSTVALLVVLLVGAVYQTIVATAARDLADQRLRDATEVAEEIVFSIDNELETVAGGSGVRKKLLESSRELLDSLRGGQALSPNVDQDLIRTRVIAHQRRGILALTNDDLQVAQAEFEAAHAGARTLAMEDRTNALYFADLRNAADNLAAVYRMQGEFGRAREKLDEAIDIAEFLTSSKPHASDFRSAVASVHTNRAALEQDMGNFEAATEEAEKALAIEQGLASQFPHKLSFRTAPAMTLNLLGDISLDAADPGNAGNYFTRALDLRLELLEEDPENASLIRDVVHSYSRLGWALLRQGKLDRAHANLSQGLERVSALALAEPTNSEYLGLQATFHDRLGVIADMRSDADQARNHFLTYKGIADTLVARDPGSFGRLSAQIYAALRLGDFEYELQNHDAAGVQYSNALEAALSLFRLHPEHVEAIRLMALAHDKSGNVAMARGLHESAKSHYLEYLKWSEELVTKVPSSLQYKMDKTQANGHLGELGLASGKVVEGARHYDQGLKLAREIMSPEAGPQLHRNLWSQLLGLCKARFMQGDVDASEQLCQEALKVTSNLLEREPANPEFLAMRDQSEQYLSVVNEPQP